MQPPSTRGARWGQGVAGTAIVAVVPESPRREENNVYEASELPGGGRVGLLLQTTHKPCLTHPLSLAPLQGVPKLMQRKEALQCYGRGTL